MDKYLTPIAVLAGAIIIAAAFAFGRGDGAALQGNNPPAQPVDIADVTVAGEPFLGDANAPATMAIWFDYQCSFCKRYDAETVAQLKASHVDTGKLKIVFKDFQFFPGSEDVAVFGRALWEAYPELHYQWLTGVMALPTGEGSGLTVERAKAVAAGVAGIDVGRVEQLADQKRADYLKAIQASRTEGGTFGITGTPATIIGTQMLGGAQPYATVSAAIDAL